MSKTILKSGFVLERRKIKYGRKLESYALQVSFYRCIYLITRWQLAVDNSQPCVAWFGLPENMVAESGIPVVPSSSEISEMTR
jgi:hypothetical protein